MGEYSKQAGEREKKADIRGKITKTEAREYISRLTYAEKIRLNELLKVLEQKRRLSPSHPGSVGTND